MEEAVRSGVGGTSFEAYVMRISKSIDGLRIGYSTSNSRSSSESESQSSSSSSSSHDNSPAH